LIRALDAQLVEQRSPIIHGMFPLFPRDLSPAAEALSPSPRNVSPSPRNVSRSALSPIRLEILGASAESSIRAKSFPARNALNMREKHRTTQLGSRLGRGENGELFALFVSCGLRQLRSDSSLCILFCSRRRRQAMAIASTDKPLSALRAETVDRLILNYGHGKLSLDAFERRLDLALDARTHEALISLTQDLELTTDEEYRERRESELGLRAEAAEPRDVEHMVHVFGGSNRRGEWTVAKEIQMLNVFGGTELDFSEARFSAQTTRIKMICVFGGATLYVPEGVDVRSKAVCIFGGIDNRASSPSAGMGPTIIVEGFMLFGGAKIAVKKTLKERLIGFANMLRSTFAELA
jgi:hypothetical protein